MRTSSTGVLVAAMESRATAMAEVRVHPLWPAPMRGKAALCAPRLAATLRAFW